MYTIILILFAFFGIFFLIKTWVSLNQLNKNVEEQDEIIIDSEKQLIHLQTARIVSINEMYFSAIPEIRKEGILAYISFLQEELNAKRQLNITPTPNFHSRESIVLIVDLIAELELEIATIEQLIPK
jgi:hypothetical protein